MTKNLLLPIFITCSFIARSQTQEQKDSLISVMCNSINSELDISDSMKVQNAYEAHLYPFLSNYLEENRQNIGMAIYIRFQRNCKEFAEILNRLNPPKGDWKTVYEKPDVISKKKVCRNFLSHQNYYYLENNGDTVNVEIKNDYWIDHFKNGTYSKLKFRWIDDCEFEIEFVDSNNQLRKNFSKPGDNYKYQVINKNEGSYDMSVEISEPLSFMTFKLYY